MVNTIQMPAYRNGMLVIKEHHTPECGDTTEIDFYYIIYLFPTSQAANDKARPCFSLENFESPQHQKH
jgi:hypothetical protein